MVRPCFLVVDKQYPGNISTRKLVIETALLNVLTAYSAKEAIETLARFPKVDGIVIDIEAYDMPCRKLIDELRKINHDIPVVTVSPSGHDRCGGEQYHVSSYDPEDLLNQLQAICSKDTRRALEECVPPPGNEAGKQRIEEEHSRSRL
ncbi:MAG TPA: response regulator [Terracidiphilus sp.]|jgi:CheY-like chemotaxis protein